MVRLDLADVSANGNARHYDDEWISARSFCVVALLRGMPNLFADTRMFPSVLLVVLCLMLPTAATAHNGPPFPIIEKKKIGTCEYALWTHPDVGTGAFYVFIEPSPGGRVPDDLKIRIGVQPVTGRLPETFYDAWRVKSRGQVQFNDQAAFY